MQDRVDADEVSKRVLLLASLFSKSVSLSFSVAEPKGGFGSELSYDFESANQAHKTVNIINILKTNGCLITKEKYTYIICPPVII